MLDRNLMTRAFQSGACLTCLFTLMMGCGPGENQNSFDHQLSIVDSAPMESQTGSLDADGGATTLVSETGDKLQRQIVYDSHLKLVVVRYKDFESAIVQLVEKYDGYISNSETDRRFENRQSGTWVTRIPVESYAEFLQAVTLLGFPESRTENAKDITAEYVDVQARIRNNQQLEQRILTILEERTGKLSDVLEVERELARVRDEIERMQGRMRVLADQSSLATITIEVREEQEYVPPTAPTLSSRLTTTWSDSVQSLRRTGTGLLLVIVAVTPWLVTAAVLALLAFAILRFVAKRFR